MRLMGGILVSAVALGCTPWDLRDDDADGLLNGDEEMLGTDPENPDTSGNGLTDWEEVCVYFTDPLEVDSSGNGISDFDEVMAGTPPWNPYIYPLDEGNYNLGDAHEPAEATDKSATGPFGARWGEGDVVENFTTFDAYDQKVDLYSFQGRYIWLIFSAEWCGPCQNLAAQAPAIQEKYPELVIIEVLVEGIDYQPADLEALQRWHDDFDLDGIPTLADDDYQYWQSYARDGGLPGMAILNPDMEVVTDSRFADPGPFISDDWGSGEPPTPSGLPESCDEPPPEE